MKYKRIIIAIIGILAIAIFVNLYDWYPQYKSLDDRIEPEYATERGVTQSGTLLTTLQVGDALTQGSKWDSEDCSVYCAKTTQTKTELYVNVVPDGFAVFDVIVQLRDGKEVNVHRECTDLSYTQVIWVPITVDKVNSVTIVAKWVECSELVLTKMEGSNKINLASRNTASFKKSGMYMIFDRYLNVIEVVDVRRNEKFIISTESTYFSEVRKL